MYLKSVLPFVMKLIHARIGRLRQTGIHYYFLPVSVVCLITIAVEFVDSLSITHHFAMYTSAVVISAFLGGFKAGIIASILCVLAIDYFVLPPPGFSLHRQSLETFELLLAFIGVGALTSALAQRLLSAKLTAELEVHRQRDLLDEYERHQRVKDNFLAVVSHELRTPATSINNWIHLLRTRKFSDEEMERALAAIDRGVKSQVSIIEDLMDLSRIAAENFSLRFERIELLRIIRDVCELQSQIAEAKSIRLEYRCMETNIHLQGDGERLQQVFMNIIANGIKFTPAGGSITVDVTLSPEFVVVRVSDTGIGIEPDQLPHVFEHLWQADDTRSRHHGLGLGLSISKYIVDHHCLGSKQGRIKAESAGKGKGASFTVELPTR